MNTALPRDGSPRAVPANAADAGLPRPASPVQGWVQTVLRRPLFASDRRPAVGTAADVVSAALPRVAGIMVSGDGRSVIFAAADGGRPLVAKEGAEVSGFRVQSIETGQVTMIGPNGPLVLRPSFDPAPRPAATVQTSITPGLPGLPGFGAPAGPSAR